jgi:DNA-binding transcriptional regulator YiaG/DNA-binding transcriptional ArsR family regulator
MNSQRVGRKGRGKVNTTEVLTIGQIIRRARLELGMSQYVLADRLAAVSGKPTMGRDRVARWERGSQVPRNEWRQWLSAVLNVPAERLDQGAEAARRQNRLGHALVTSTSKTTAGTARRSQGTPALLPVFRSRVQAGILAATLLNPSRAFSLSELAEEAGGSLASVSKESKILEEAGILYTRYDGAIRLIRAATDKPMLTPLTELIRVTYGVPQVIGEEFGRVTGIARISLTGTWAERFAGVTGPEPESIQVRLIPLADEHPDERELRAAARRAEIRLHRAVVFAVARPRPTAPDRMRHTPRPGVPARLPLQRKRGPVVHIAPLATPDAMPPAAEAWATGADVIARLRECGHLELFSGQSADSRPHFEVAEHHLASAENILTMSPESAFVLVCQAAQAIGTGLLAAQGLRVTAGSPGDVLGQALVAQFGPQFRQIELLRQRQLAMTDPSWRDNRVADIDVGGALPAIRALLKSAQDLAIELNLFV